MTLKNKFFNEGVAYVTPCVTVLDAQVEGVLCESFTNGGGGSYSDGDINDNGGY